MTFEPKPATVTCPCLQFLDHGTVGGVKLILPPLAAGKMREWFLEAVDAAAVAAATAMQGQQHPWCFSGTARIFATAFGRLLAGLALPTSLDPRGTLHDRMTDDQWDELMEFARVEFDRCTVAFTNDPEDPSNV